MYVFIFSYKEYISERKSYSVKSSFLLVPQCPVRMTGYSILLKMNHCLFSCTSLQETPFVCG